MWEWSHGLPGSDSWVSLIFGELMEGPDNAELVGQTRVADAPRAEHNQSAVVP
jgi:hypothetical protein